MTYLEDGRCSFLTTSVKMRSVHLQSAAKIGCSAIHLMVPRPWCYSIYDGRNGQGKWRERLSLFNLSSGKVRDDSMSDNELDQLAPWNEKVKIEIERRTKNSNQS